MDLTAFPGRNGTGHSEVPYSAFADPCVNHTVLDQAWRSIDCGLLECLIGLICDESLQQGWYRFNSFGGWKIPEIVIPLTNCSSWSTGWLNDIQYQWVNVLLTLEMEIKIEEAKKIALQRLQKMVNKRAGRELELALEEGYCLAMDLLESEGS
ncbi:uromodulin-like isoform X3 [Stegostoma tigrinum]|uniref:uromodulin-like isoform X3 n=1 Tax=Stegostoma tigrinum TaxID=3053191 RepID=UPI002870AA4D|nr:uromodulin-like isoform X3 [Stegostoma tigrinum]